MIAQAACTPDDDGTWEWCRVDELLNPPADATWESLYDGLWITIQATLVGAVIAVVLGLVFALMRRSTVRPVSWVATGIVEFIRSTPLLVQLFFLFFVIVPTLFSGMGVETQAKVAGFTGIGLHYATYMSEVYRAGIDGVPKGQWEASTALSLPRTRVWTSVILPQAIPRVLPALGNYIIAMFKEVPLLSTITVTELLFNAQRYGSDTFQYTEAITLVGVFFLIVSIITAVPIRMLERRYGHI
jgi:polar amino acid transport system permease protein